MEKDPEIEINLPIMEQIWGQVPKEHNLPPAFKGEYIRYVATDPKYLYMTGFVDAKRYKLEEWEAAFQDCKQPDGSYLISKEKFLSLGKYKYSGYIKKPLDPMKIREGWYETNDWHEFCVKSIVPSTDITVDTLVQIEKQMKEKGRIVNGRIFIDKFVKLNIKQMLDNYPSPARRRELSVNDLYQKRIAQEVKRSESPIVKTTFEKGKKLGDDQKKNLREVLVKDSKISLKSKEETPTLSLKDLRKKSKTKKQTL